MWDWERFTQGVPVGFDPIHFEMQAAIQRRAHPPRVAAARQSRLLRRCCAASDWTSSRPSGWRCSTCSRSVPRHVADDQARAGALLGNVQEWLMPVLATAVSELAPRRAG